MRYVTFIVMLSLLVLLGYPAWAGKLTILTEEWKPVAFSSEKGKPAGLAVEIVREILSRLNEPDTIKIVPWPRGYKTALNKPNVVLFAMTLTPERLHLFKMIGPIALGKTTLYAKKGSPITIKSLDEAKKLTSIGVYRDTAAEQILKQAGFNNLDIVSSPDLNIRKLMVGRIDVLSGVNLTIGELLMKEGISRDAVDGVFNIGENKLYIAMSKGTSEKIVQKWKNMLEKMHQNGTFKRIYHSWLPGEEVPLKVERVGIKD